MWVRSGKGELGTQYALKRSSGHGNVSENGQLSCSKEQFDGYTNNILLAGEMTVSQQPDSGTLAQQQKTINAFSALSLPKGKTVIAAGHTESGEIDTTTCQNEKMYAERNGAARTGPPERALE